MPSIEVLKQDAFRSGVPHPHQPRISAVDDHLRIVKRQRFHMHARGFELTLPTCSAILRESLRNP